MAQHDRIEVPQAPRILGRITAPLEELRPDPVAVAVEYRHRDLNLVHARRVPWPERHD
jgi:hypothetical protein